MNDQELFRNWRGFIDGEEEKTVINERMDPGGSTGGPWAPPSPSTSIPAEPGGLDGQTPDLCGSLEAVLADVGWDAIPAIIEQWYFHGKIKSKAAAYLVSGLFGSAALVQGTRKFVARGLGVLISGAMLGYNAGRASKNPTCIKLFKQLYEYFATDIRKDLTPEEQEVLEKRMQFFGEQEQEEWNRLDENRQSTNMDEDIIRKAILKVLPHADIRFMRVIGSSTLNPEQYAAHAIAKYGEAGGGGPDIDIEVEVSGISNEDVEAWAHSAGADELEFTYNYDVQLRVVNEADESKITKLRIFDFDDTLAKTTEVVHVRDKRTDEIIKTLETQEDLDEFGLAPEEAKEDAYLDFDEFNTIKNPEEIKVITKILKDVVRAEESDPQRVIMILTARQQEAAADIKSFLESIGIDTKYIEIVGVGDSALKAGQELSDIGRRAREIPAEQRKVDKIRELLEKHKTIKEILFFDDSLANLSAVKKLHDEEYPEINFELKKITHTPQGLRVGRIREAAGQGEIQRKYATQWQNALSKLDLGGNRYLGKGMQRRRGRKSGSAPPGLGEAVRATTSSTLVAIFGASGCGKSRMKQAFMNMGFSEIKSFTTRGRRGGADQDIEYEFTSLDDFLSELQSGELVNVNQYNNNWYGTRVSSLEETDQNAVLLTDISSLQKLYEIAQDLRKEMMFVYCASPPLKELIRRHRERLKSGEYKNRDEFEERLMMAVNETEEMDSIVASLSAQLPIFDFEEVKSKLGL